MMNKIDSHAHVFKYKDHWPEDAGAIWVKEEAGVTTGPPVHWVTGEALTPDDFNAPYEDYIQIMNNSGVEKAFLLGQYIGHLNIKVPKEYLFEAIQKYPQRFYAFIAPDPLGGTKSQDEIEWAITNGFTGIKLLPSYHGLDPLDKRLWPIYQKACSLGVPIIFHTGSGPLPQNKMKLQEPYAFEDILIEFPQINICFGHSGFHRAIDVFMMMRRHKNLYGDLAYWCMFPEDYIARLLVFAKKIEVIDRIMWRTDYPRLDPKTDSEIYVNIVKYTRDNNFDPEINEEDLNLIFRENALRFIQKKK